jgi:hypothetical protein
MHPSQKMSNDLDIGQHFEQVRNRMQQEAQQTQERNQQAATNASINSRRTGRMSRQDEVSLAAHTRREEQRRQAKRDKKRLYMTCDWVGRVIYVYAYVFVWLSWCERSGNQTNSHDILGYKYLSYTISEPNKPYIPFGPWELMNLSTTAIVYVGMYLSEMRTKPNHRVVKLLSKLSMCSIYYFLWFCAVNKDLIEKSDFAYYVLFLISWGLMWIRVFINSRDVNWTDIKMIWLV